MARSVRKVANIGDITYLLINRLDFVVTDGAMCCVLNIWQREVRPGYSNA